MTVAQAFEAERDPAAPTAKSQYRLILQTPGHNCSDWQKVTPLLPKEDLIVSSLNRDMEGKGCRFIWVIAPATQPGATLFELQRAGTPKETFELAAPNAFQDATPAAVAPPSVVSDGLTLRQHMKALSNLFRELRDSVTDQTENAENVANAEKMVQLFQSIRSQAPRSLADLPSDQQATELASYQSLIDENIRAATELKAAFTSGKNDEAAGLLAKIDADRKDGHRKFKRH